jgi:small subunit ribosomal protein S8
MSVDIIGDFLTSIRNAVMVSKLHMVTPFSTMRLAIAQILKNEGFIREFEVINDTHTYLKLHFKYVDGESPIHKIQRISKLGRRQYARKNTIKPVGGGLGISILTTNRGVMTNKQAQRLGVGGEVVCTVW